MHLSEMTSFFNRALALGLALLSTPALAQGDVVSSDDPDRFFILMQGFREGPLSGAGLSSAFGVSVADVGSANPASLSAFERPEVGLAYRFETSIPDGYVAGIEYQAMNGARPQSAAAVVPLGAWTLGASYSQRYAAEMDFGCIPRMTESDPNSDEIAFCATQSARLETVSPQVAYRTALQTGSELTFGLRLGIGYARITSTIDSLEGSFSDVGAQVAVGVRYRKPGAFGLAAYYESALRVEGSATFEGEGPDPTIGPTGEGELVGEIRNLGQFGDAIPARLGASAEVEVRPRVRLGADAAWVFWKGAWDSDEQFEDNAEAALWGRLDLSERALVSAGLRWQDRDRWDNGFEDIVDYSGRAIYLTAGGALTFDRLRFDAVVADSHLLSGQEQRQTIAKLGASVRL